MKKQFISGICLIASLFTLNACGPKKQKTANGLEYEIHTKGEGRQSEMGDIIKGKLVLSTDKGDTLFSVDESLPILKIQQSIYPGDLNEGLLALSEGDSASFYVPADSLKKYMGGLPAEIDEFMVYSVKIDRLYTEEELEAEQKAEEDAALAAEQAAIARYLEENAIKIEPEESGIYFISTKKGSGKTIAQGQAVKVNYIGKLLNGKLFDTNIESVAKENNVYNPQRPYEPMEVPAGVGQMIPGFDEALLKMKKGGKATVIIPFAQAYGSRDMGPDIPAYSTLVFDIEIVDAE